MVDDATLKKQFYQEMISTYNDAAKIGYRPTRFLQMIHEQGAVETAHRLISENLSDGVTKLWNLKRLDLSAEALILKPEYATLFSEEERAKARKLLADLEYTAPWDSASKTPTPTKEITGAEAGLTQMDQIQIALRVMIEHTGVASMQQIYEAVEALLDGKKLSEQGKASLRNFVNTGAVQAGYAYPYDDNNPGWRITEKGRALLGETNTHTPLAWIFQSNPEIYDLVGALEELTEMTWVVRQHADSIHSGDTVYLWESGTNAGVVAIATISSPPQEMEQDEVEEIFYKDISGFEGKQLRVRLHIEKILPERIKKSALQSDPILKDYYFLKSAQGTNFKLTPEQADALKTLVEPTPITEEYIAGKSLIERLENASKATEETKVEPEMEEPLDPNVNWREFHNRIFSLEEWLSHLEKLQHPLTRQIAQEYPVWLKENFGNQIQQFYWLETSQENQVPALTLQVKGQIQIKCFFNLSRFAFITVVNPTPEEIDYLQKNLSPESHFDPRTTAYWLKKGKPYRFELHKPGDYVALQNYTRQLMARGIVSQPVGENDLIDQLKETFEEFRADPLTRLRIKVRRKRATQLRQTLATPGKVDVNFFNHDVWVFEDDTRLGDVTIKGTIFGKKALEPTRIVELEEALESDKLTLRGNYIWGSGARVYGSTMVRQEDGTDSRAENIEQALRILASTGLITPLEKADGILKIKGFGQNITTGLVMVFHPDEFAIYNTISQETMRLLGYRTNTLPIFQEQSRKLKQLLGAEDFLEQDWFLYCLTHEQDGEIESLKELRQLLEVNPDDALEEEDDDGAVLSLQEWQQSIVTDPAFIERLVKGFPEWLTNTFGETITLKPRSRQRLSILVSGRIHLGIGFNKKNGLYVQIHKPSSEILNLLKQDLSKPETLMIFGDNPEIYRFIIYSAKDYELLQKITSLLVNNRLELWPPQPLDGPAFVVIHGSDFESQKYGESYTFTKKAAGDSKELIEAVKKIEQTPVYLIIYRPGPKYAFTAWAKVTKVGEELTEQKDEVEYKLSLQHYDFPKALNLQDAANPLRKQIKWLSGTLVQAFNFHSIRKITDEDFSNIIKATIETTQLLYDPAALEELIGHFKRAYGSFNSEFYLEEERYYKIKAADKIRKLLNKQRLGNMVETKMHSETKSDIRRSHSPDKENPNINFLNLYDIAPFDNTAAEKLAPQLYDVLYGERPFIERLNDWIALLQEKDTPKCWPVATYHLMFLNPEEHIFVKPAPFRIFLELINSSLAWQPKTSTAFYIQLQTLAWQLLTALKPFGARDLIDVQSFIWIMQDIEQI